MLIVESVPIFLGPQFIPFIQYYARARTGWTQRRSRTQNSSVPRQLHIDKLSDAFGQYEILLTCKCGHTRRVHPRTLAAICRWEALLVDVGKRLRCTKCSRRECKVEPIPLIAPRGRSSH
jgi:hypothetical protein